MAKNYDDDDSGGWIKVTCEELKKISERLACLWSVLNFWEGARLTAPVTKAQQTTCQTKFFSLLRETEWIGNCTKVSSSLFYLQLFCNHKKGFAYQKVAFFFFLTLCQCSLITNTWSGGLWLWHRRTD